MPGADAPTAIVVGAGVFGASTALALVERGWRVTLVEEHAPGHVRASSGDESRLLRCSHGEDAWYTRSAWQARQAWIELGERVGRTLFTECGMAWFAQRSDGWEASSRRTLDAEGIPAVTLDPADAARLFPSLGVDDLDHVLLEPHAGVLAAREGVKALVEVAVGLGAEVTRARARHDGGGGVVIDGRRREADRVVWACGPWLVREFDEVAARVTRQEVVYYGVDAGWRADAIPAFVDYDGAAYGHGDLDGRGFKCAPDVEGPDFDPDNGERIPDAQTLALARAYLRRRFPALADAPVVGTRTCQYTLTADTHFIIAERAAGQWVVGGGSGHGFKHGPVLGAVVADAVAGVSAPDPRFALGPRAATGALRTAGGRRPSGGPSGAAPAGDPGSG